MEKTNPRLKWPAEHAFFFNVTQMYMEEARGKRVFAEKPSPMAYYLGYV